MVSSAGNARTLLGCPYYSADADWAHNVFVPEFAWNLRQVASVRNGEYHNVQFLDLSHLFDGHEVCSTATTRPDLITAPNPATNEWVRALSYAQPLTPDQAGYHNESFHPNAFGQQAIGRCIALLNTMPASGDYSCTGAPNISPSQVQLASMDNATYRFVNVGTNKVMALNGPGYFTNGDAAILWDDNGTSDHNWQLVPEGNGYYKIRNVYTGKVLGVMGWGSNVAPVIEWDDNGTPDHDWQIVYGVQGGFQFVNRYSGMYLTADVSGANGAQLFQSSASGYKPISSWQFVRN
jgi:hypothetical protein